MQKVRLCRFSILTYDTSYSSHLDWAQYCVIGTQHWFIPVHTSRHQLWQCSSKLRNTRTAETRFKVRWIYKASKTKKIFIYLACGSWISFPFSILFQEPIGMSLGIPTNAIWPNITLLNFSNLYTQALLLSCLNCLCQFCVRCQPMHSWMCEFLNTVPESSS